MKKDISATKRDVKNYNTKWITKTPDENISLKVFKKYQRVKREICMLEYSNGVLKNKYEILVVFESYHVNLFSGYFDFIVYHFDII